MSERSKRWVVVGGLVAYVFFAMAGCSSQPEFDGGGDGDGDTSGDGDGDGDGDDISIGGMSGDGDGDGDGIPVSPCGELFCTEDQHCEEDDGEADCVPNECDDLDCEESEECISTSLGAHCEDLSCDEDVDCPGNRYCDVQAGLCKDDICLPGARSCSESGESGESGSRVFVCSSNGGGFVVEAECGSASGFESTCVEQSSGKAGCGCEDDWDCPGFQECEAGVCQGALSAPSCRLEPADLDDVLPSQELVWGTDFGGSDQGRLRVLDGVDVPLVGEETGAAGEPAPASLSSWHTSAQATQVPIVANLDDDNGDGVVDERDVPEILFVTFTGSNRVNNNGILRAIHGGGTDSAGSKKGRDYFAVCGQNRWFSGQYWDGAGTLLENEPDCGNAADLDPAATVAVGDLNYDGLPEIVAFTEEDGRDGSNDFDTQRGRFVIYDNTGKRLLRSEAYDFGLTQNDDSAAENPGVSLANVVPAADLESEMVEIIIGRDLFTIETDAGTWSVTGRYQGGSASGINTQGPVSCVADLIAERPGMEIVAGSAVYGIPLDGDVLDTTQGALVTLGSDNGARGFCAIADVWGGNAGVAPGPANPLDGTPELVLVRGGRLYVHGFEVQEPNDPGEEWSVTLTDLVDGDPLPVGNEGGGAPNIDDFDGDGFPEIGTAASQGYVLFDLQDAGGDCPEWTDFEDPTTDKVRSVPSGSCDSDSECNSDSDTSTWQYACNENADVGNGACVCLHNSWRRKTQDDSSKVTGSSVFDFNGDGSAEVIYNDECHFRMYRGIDGGEAFLEPSESRTRIEYPVVADADNDGNAEIVFATSTESRFCNEQVVSCSVHADCPSGTAEKGQRCIDGHCQIPNADQVFNAGIEVWGDLSDRWVSARRVWNQYSYHVTNVNESGGIPRSEPDSWKPLGSRFYNTYRSQPRSFGSAPDLVIDALQVIAPGSCGDSSNLVIAVQVKNEGDLRVGNVPVSFMGTWDDASVTEPLTDSSGEPLVHLITQTLEANAYVVFQVEYDQDDNDRGSFPDRVMVLVDPASSGMDEGVARECKEDNNTASADVEAAPALPDLRLLLEDPDDECPPAILGTVINDSNVAAADVTVRIYRGDPANGASAIGDLYLGSVAAGESIEFDSDDEKFEFDGVVPGAAPVRFFGDVDPDDSVAECNESNNRDGPTAPSSCMLIAR